MPQYVEIPGQGVAEFPDEMAPEAIEKVLSAQFKAPDTEAPATTTLAPESPKLSAADYLKQAVGSGGRGMADVISGTPQAIALGGQAMDRAFPVLKAAGESKGIESPLYKLGEGIQSAGKALTPAEVPELRDSFWATKVPQGLGSAAGFMVGGLAGKALKIPALASTMILGAASGGVEGFKDAQAKKASDDQALDSFLLNAGVGTSEALTLTKWLKHLNGMSGGSLVKVLKNTARDTLEEALQEAFQSGAGDLIAKHIVKYDPDRKLFGTMAQGAAAGGVTGLLFSLATQAIGAKLGKMRGPGEPAADNQSEDALGKVDVADAPAEPGTRFVPEPPAGSEAIITVAPESQGINPALPDEVKPTEPRPLYLEEIWDRLAQIEKEHGPLNEFNYKRNKFEPRRIPTVEEDRLLKLLDSAEQTPVEPAAKQQPPTPEEGGQPNSVNVASQQVSPIEQATKESEGKLFNSDEHKANWIEHRTSEIEYEASTPHSPERKTAREKLRIAREKPNVTYAPSINNPLDQVFMRGDPETKITAVSDATGAVWDGALDKNGSRKIRFPNGNVAWVEVSRLRPEQVRALNENSVTESTKPNLLDSEPTAPNKGDSDAVPDKSPAVLSVEKPAPAGQAAVDAPRAERPAEAQAAAPGQAQVAPSLRDILELPDAEFAQRLNTHNGDYGPRAQGYAYEVGASAKTPEDVAAIQDAYQKLKAKRDALSDEELDQAMPIQQRMSVLHEAYDAATGKNIAGAEGSAVEAIRKIKPDYQPPVPAEAAKPNEPTPAPAAPPAEKSWGQKFAEEAEAARIAADAAYRKRLAGTAPKPKETLPQLIKRVGRQAVDEMVGEWDANASLSPDGKSLTVYADPRNRTGKMRGSSKEFMAWVEEQSAKPAEVISEPGKPEPAKGGEIPNEQGKRQEEGVQEVAPEVQPEVEKPAPIEAPKSETPVSLPDQIPDFGATTFQTRGPSGEAANMPRAAVTPLIEQYEKKFAGIFQKAVKETPRGENEGLMEYRDRIKASVPLNQADIPLLEKIVDGLETNIKAIEADIANEKSPRTVKLLQSDLAGVKGLKSNYLTKLEQHKQAAPVEAPQAEAPAEAVNQVQAQVSKVAGTEGKPSAKAVKNEMISRLESALEQAPSVKDMPLVVQQQLEMAQQRPNLSGRNYQYGKKGDAQHAKDYAIERERLDKLATDAGFKKITLSIPGDGDLTIWNTKENIQNVLDAAKRIKTGSTPVAKIGRSRMDAAEYLKRDVQDAVTVYGDESNAYQKLSSQLARAGELELDPAQVGRLRKLVSELERKIRMPWEKTHEEMMQVWKERDIENGKGQYRTETQRLADLNKRLKTLQEKEASELELMHQKLGKEPRSEAPAESPKPPVIGPPVIPEGGDIIGMGGAVPGEFATGQGRPTSNRLAEIDRERVQRGLEPLTKPESVTDQAMLDKAKGKMDADPSYADRLVAELNANPRVIEDWENHVLLLRKVELRHEWEKSAREAAQAYDDSMQFPNRLEAMHEANARTEALSAKLTELEQASRVSGSARGRALRALRVMVNEDYSLARMELQKRADNGGRPLTPEERSQLVKAADEYKARAEAAERATAESETRNARLEAEKALAEAKAAAAESAPKFHPSVLDYAEKFVKGMEGIADKYSQELRGAVWSPTPDMLAKAAFVGAARLARLGLDSAKWTDAMVRELGEKFRPYAAEVYEASKKLLDEKLTAAKSSAGVKIGPAIKHKMDLAEQMEVHKARIEAKIEKGDGAGITPQVKKLAEGLWQQGIQKLEPMIDALHAILKETQPEITRQETMDALSGRGKFWQASQNEIKKGVRDLSTQARLVAHQMDVLARKPLPRTGYQPDKMSDAARREQQVLEDLKRRFGVTVTNPAAQLASALSARKTYYTHRIADLKAEIKAREKTVKTKSPSPTDAALERLKAEYAQVKAEHDAIFPKDRSVTPEQQLKMATAAAERNAAEWDRRLLEAKKGNFDTRRAPGRKVTSAELEAIKARTEAVKAEVQQLKDLSQPKRTPAQIALQAYKTRTLNRIAELQERIAAGDFSKKPKRELVLDAEAVKAQHELEVWKQNYEEARFKDLLAKRTQAQRVMARIAETIHVARAIKTSFDISGIGRQGFILAVVHPVRAAKVLPSMLRAMVSPLQQFRIEQQIKSRENYPTYKRSGLYISERGQGLAAMEEAYMSRWADKIPGVAASQRAYTTFLNVLRADSFDAMEAGLSRTGKASPVEAQAIANYINVATGRGKFTKSGDNAAVFLNTVFFAPRFVTSRFQFLAGQPLYRGSMRTRKMIAGEYLRFFVGISIMYGLAKLAGFDVEDDLRSGEAGKIKVGASYVDPLAGLLQPSVLASRVFTGETKKGNGKIVTIRGETPYGQDDIGSYAGRFGESKLSPSAALAWHAITGKDYNSKAITPAGLVKDFGMPLSWDTAYEVMKANGVPESIILNLLQLAGAGVQTYE